jgi:hypothetical protein
MHGSEKTPRELELERISANHLKHRQRGDGVDAAAPEEKPKPEDEKGPDLDDHATQERILHPDGTDVELSYGTARLFPPSVAMSRRISGFISRVFADAVSSGGPMTLLSLRIASVITERPAIESDVLLYAAYLCGKPGAVDAKAASEIAEEISSQANADDIAVIFAKLCDAVHFNPFKVAERKN